MSKIFDLDFRKGTLIDSVSGTAGTNYNGEIVQTEKGLAWKGNGVDSRVVTNTPSDLLGLKDYSLVLAFKQTSSKATYIFTNGQNSGNEGTGFRTYNDKLYMEQKADGGSRFFPGNLILDKYNKWVFAIGTADRDGLLSLYLDGNFASSTNISADADKTITGSANTFIIGDGSTIGTGYTFNGLILFAQIYDHLLDSKERTQLYKEFLNSHPIHNVNRPSYIDLKPKDLSNEDGLVAAYNMVPQGDTLVDISGNGYNGTIYGAVSTKDGMFFDGNSSYVDCGSGQSLKGVVFTFICYDTSLTIQNVLAGIFNNGYGVSVYFGYLVFASWNTIDDGYKVPIQEGILYSVGANLLEDGSFDVWLNGEKVTLTSPTNGYQYTQGFTIGGRVPYKDNYFNGEIRDVRVYNRNLTSQEIKDYHNSFAKQVSLRESFSDDAVGKQPLNWDVQSGSFSVQEMTTQDSVLKHLDKGAKYLQCDSAGQIAIQSDQAYGEWEFDWYKGGDTNNIIVGLLSPEPNTLPVDGAYDFHVQSDESIRIVKRQSSSSITIMLSKPAYIALNTWYKTKITRTVDGEFALYIKGGSFGDTYQLLDTTGGYGTNPSTDNTFTTSNYFILYAGANDRIANIKLNKAVKQ